MWVPFGRKEKALAGGDYALINRKIVVHAMDEIDRQKYGIMRANGWKQILIAGLLLILTIDGQAQDESETVSALDWLPAWRFVDPSTASGRWSRPIPSDGPTYADVNDLMRQHTSGQRIESLILTGRSLGRDGYKLRPLLQQLRVLTLKNLTTAQADSLFGQFGPGTRLERLTIDITYYGPNRPDSNRLVRLPAALRRFRQLRELRIREDGLDWGTSLPVLAGMSALRRLELDRWQSQPGGSQQPVLTSLRQVTALRLINNWQLTPEIFGSLPRLTDLDLLSLPVETGTLAQILNQLTALETLRLTKCWQVRNLNFSKLKHLKTIELAYNDQLGIDTALLAGMPNVERFTFRGGQPLDLSGLGNLRKLRYLNVIGNGQSTRLPKTIGALHQLADLRLYNVRLESLPPDFGRFQRLQTLHLNQCGLDSLPVTFGRLNALRDLRLYGNKLRNLFMIEWPRSLRQLNISGNQLTKLPDAIGRLSQLTQLNVSENQLTELPASLTRLTNLKHLVAEHNQLERLPDELGQLTRLTDLAIGANQLRQLPASLSQLISLTAISVNSNQLESLPDDIGNLRQLRFLSLSNNQLTALPNSIGQLDSLRYLWIGTNRLRTLPASLGQLRSLTDLTIEANELTELPGSVGNLYQLTHLLLSKLPVTQLPASMGSLGKLRSLIIQDTKLRTLPESVGALTNLDYVRLTNNELTTLPNSIGQWQALTTLELNGHALERLPDGIGRMTNLTEVIIGRKNQVGALRQLPDSIVHCDRLQKLTIENQPYLDAADVFRKAARLKNLSDLLVVNCNVARLPDVNWKMVSWQKLTLVHNQLTELPTGLLDAPKLQYIQARQNPLLGALDRDFNGKQTLLGAFMEAGKLPPDVVARPNAEVTEALLRTANERGSAGDWVGAVKALGKAIESAPDSMKEIPYGERASLYHAHKQYANALADLDSAIRYAPELRYSGLHNPFRLTAHWKWKGYIFAEISQYDDALNSLAQAERLLPPDPLPKYAESVGSNELDRARYLTLQGKLPTAETSFRKAIDAYEQAQQRSHVGIRLKVVEICLLTGQYDRAREILNNLSDKQRGQVKNGYESLNEYLRLCLAVLDGSQTGEQALVKLKTFFDAHPQTITWRFALTDTWLLYHRIDNELIVSFRKLLELTRERVVERM